MKKSISYVIIFTIFLASSAIYAQANIGTITPVRITPIQMSGLDKPIEADKYTLMPGDTLLVIVTGATNYSYLTAVTFEGKVMINVPVRSIMTTVPGEEIPQYDIVSAVLVHGMTLETAKDSLRRIFLKYHRNIKVDLTLISMRQFTVFVVGEVRQPGMIIAWPVDRVSSVVNRAGGVTYRGSRSTVEVWRDDTLFQKADLEKFEKSGDKSVNPNVQDGDLIVVPKMKKSVIVKGAVFGKRGYELRVAEMTVARERISEGQYELVENERVSDMLRKAGGVTPWAELSLGFIERNEQRIPVNLANVLADESSEDNMLMQDGDVLVAPRKNELVYIMGEVGHPGSLPHEINLTAMDYIAMASGPLETANLDASYVMREKKKISVSSNPVLEVGDKIMVPRRGFLYWKDYLELSIVIGAFILSYLAYTSPN